MNIVIENRKFSYDVGVRLLKLKYDECPFEQLEDIWEDIVPMTFKEIAKLENVEERRVGIFCLGIEKLIKEVEPTLINKTTISKETTWVGEGGELSNIAFDDTYELYGVSNELLFGSGWNFRRNDSSHYVKCKDTSTDREYLLWVDLNSVYRTNFPDDRWGFKPENEIEELVNAIQAIAWTIQTDIPEGNIKKIIRQGDCILIKPKGTYDKLSTPRHLTEKEYRKLIVAES